MFNVSDASSGRITWKLKPTVLTTVTISRTRRASAERHAQANPSPMAFIIVGGFALGSSGTRLLSAHHQQAREHGEERDRVDREADADPEGRDQHAGDGGPTTREALKRLAFSATAFGSSSRPTIWKVSAWRPGASKTSAVLEERRAGRRPSLEAAEHEDGERCGEDHRDRLSPDHELAVVDPVGDDAGEEAEDREGDEAAEGEQADGDRRAGQLDHEPGERDVLHPGAADRDHLAGEEEAVVAVPPEA